MIMYATIYNVMRQSPTLRCLLDLASLNKKCYRIYKDLIRNTPSELNVYTIKGCNETKHPAASLRSLFLDFPERCRCHHSPCEHDKNGHSGGFQQRKIMLHFTLVRMFWGNNRRTIDRKSMDYLYYGYNLNKERYKVKRYKVKTQHRTLLSLCYDDELSNINITARDVLNENLYLVHKAGSWTMPVPIDKLL